MRKNVYFELDLIYLCLLMLILMFISVPKIHLDRVGRYSILSNQLAHL